MPKINRAYGESDGGRAAVMRISKAQDGDASHYKPQGSEKYQDDKYLRELIQALVNDDMGYLKLRLGLDTTLTHLTWTWASGTHHGHYVYVAVNTWELCMGFELLLHKRDEVYSGVRRPTPDKRRSAID